MQYAWISAAKNSLWTSAVDICIAGIQQAKVIVFLIYFIADLSKSNYYWFVYEYILILIIFLIMLSIAWHSYAIDCFNIKADVYIAYSVRVDNTRFHLVVTTQSAMFVIMCCNLLDASNHVVLLTALRLILPINKYVWYDILINVMCKI